MKKTTNSSNEDSIKNKYPYLDYQHWKYNAIFEKAKRLSVNRRFQDSVAKLRVKWHIEIATEIKSIHPGISPEIVLRGHTRHLSIRDRNLLRVEIMQIADVFQLNRNFDYGLIILSLCYGLTPNLIINHWRDVQFIAASLLGISDYVLVDLPQSYQRKRKAYLETISFLVNQLNSHNVTVKIPEDVEKYLKEASDFVTEMDSSDNVGNLDHDIFIRIGPFTKPEHIETIWPVIRRAQSKLWAVTDSDYRIWDKYDRDVNIWQKVRVEGMTYARAYELWLNDHPDENPVELSVIIKAVRKIDKMNE